MSSAITTWYSNRENSGLWSFVSITLMYTWNDMQKIKHGNNIITQIWNPIGNQKIMLQTNYRGQYKIIHIKDDQVSLLQRGKKISIHYFRSFQDSVHGLWNSYFVLQTTQLSLRWTGLFRKYNILNMYQTFPVISTIIYYLLTLLN